MEIFDEEDLTPFELQRQKNIIRNYEFMKSCGKLNQTTELDFLSST